MRLSSFCLSFPLVVSLFDVNFNAFSLIERNQERGVYVYRLYVLVFWIGRKGNPPPELGGPGDLQPPTNALREGRALGPRVTHNGVGSHQTTDYTAP